VLGGRHVGDVFVGPSFGVSCSGQTFYCSFIVHDISETAFRFSLTEETSLLSLAPPAYLDAIALNLTETAASLIQPTPIRPSHRDHPCRPHVGLRPFTITAPVTLKLPIRGVLTAIASCYRPGYDGSTHCGLVVLFVLWTLVRSAVRSFHS
jgi:hypothetical protein